MRNSINVLSLFDGISAGQLALQRAGINVKNYYASEIDVAAISVTQNHFPNTIQLGDVTKWKEWNLPWNEIDLVIGGSPCQGFSFAGKQLNFNDERSKLFFVFVDICHRVADENSKMIFMLENVKMKKEYQDVITKYLGVEPIIINSKLVSAQNRVRLYWTNIKNVIQPNDKQILFKDIINNNYQFKPLTKWFFKSWGFKIKIDTLRTINHDKSFCITTNRSHSKNYYLNSEKTMARMLERDEVETLQTFPIGYTNIASKTEAHKMLGNSWTVDVIAHIFSFLK
jgi:DNA (cytosine-5)-methyltransferase 3A